MTLATNEIEKKVRQKVYAINLDGRVRYEYHSLNNEGSTGNRTLGRSQIRPNDGSRADLISGNSQKHQIWATFIDYAIEADLPLCDACRRYSSMRAAGLETKGTETEATLVQKCVSCDWGGFLVTIKKDRSRDSVEASTNSLNTAGGSIARPSAVQCGYMISIPGTESVMNHTLTRVGANKEGGQMIYTVPSRIAEYAFSYRVELWRVGYDRKTQRLLADPEIRLQTSETLLRAISYVIMTPQGAKLATMKPHVTHLEGVITVGHRLCNLPGVSALNDDYQEIVANLVEQENEMVLNLDNYRSVGQLEGDDEKKQSKPISLLKFKTIDEFHRHMFDLILHTEPFNATEAV